MTKQMTIAEYHARVGTSFGASEWYLIDQARIDDFAKNTEDFQFIHIDTERAKACWVPRGGGGRQLERHN